MHNAFFLMVFEAVWNAGIWRRILGGITRNYSNFANKLRRITAIPDPAGQRDFRRLGD